jgi:hypothetical protein
MPETETYRAQDDRFHQDPWDDIIDRYLTSMEFNNEWVPRNPPLTVTSVSDILRYAIGLDQTRWSRSEEMRIASWLKHNSWTRKRMPDGKWKYISKDWKVGEL